MRRATLWAVLLAAASSLASDARPKPDATPGEVAAFIRAQSPDQLLCFAREALAAMPVYQMRVEKRERFNGRVGPAQNIDAWVREEPLAIRAEWAAGDKAGRRLFYDAKARPGEMRVREAGVLSLAGAVWIRIDGSLAHIDTRHSVRDLPLSGVIDLLQANFDLARPLGGPEREDLGWDASRHWCIRFTAPPGLRAEGRVIRICFDVAQRLPAEVEIEDDAGFLESYRYLHVTPAPGEAASFNLAAAGVP
jgi:hypothetical protein